MAPYSSETTEVLILALPETAGSALYGMVDVLMATGTSLMEYLQNLRIEAAKCLLEQSDQPVDAVSLAAGYEDVSFFRRLFKRLTGLTPGQYRRMFQPIGAVSDSTGSHCKRSLGIAAEREG